MNTGSVFKSDKGKLLIQDRCRDLLGAWPVSHEKRMVETSCGRTFVILSGDEDAPPLLLLHGSASNSLGWMGYAGMWSKDFRVIVADRPGEPGLSEDRRLNVAGDDYALWIENLIDSLGYTCVSIVGMSLGGFAALKFAIARPERVNKISLLTAGGIYPSKLSFLFRVLSLMMLGKFGSDRINKIVAYNTPMPAEVLEFGRLVSKYYKPLISPIPLFTDEELQKLSMPVQYFGGNKDALLYSRATAERLKANLVNVETHILNDVGHVILGQADNILDFLKG